jgi:hypothetical protein
MSVEQFVTHKKCKSRTKKLFQIRLGERGQAHLRSSGQWTVFRGQPEKQASAK